MSYLGFKHSEATKNKVRIYQKTHDNTGRFKKGKRYSPKTEFKKGQAAWNKGKHIYLGGGFKKGHSKHKNAFKWGKRDKHPNWKGGKYKNNDGYIYILNPLHPFSNQQGYIFEHRIIMEKHLGRYLTKEEIVHHINEITIDNRIQNLMCFDGVASHIRWHTKRKLVKKQNIIFDGRSAKYSHRIPIFHKL